MTRFIGGVSVRDRLNPGHRSAIERSASLHGLEMLWSSDRLLLYGPTAESMPLGENGVIIGALFRSEDKSRTVSLTLAERLAIVSTRGAALMDRYWGSYVGLVRNEHEWHLVRAPFGSLPMCLCRRESTIFIASDIDLLSDCGCDARSIDWIELARHLAAGDIRRRETCLAGITELRGGVRLTVGEDGGIQECEIWSPWPAAGHARAAASGESASASIRTTITDAVATVAGSAKKPLLLLSGGLDSSILAAVLRESGNDMAALTFVTVEKSGDERDYARLVADSLGIELIEAERQIANVDVTRSDAAGLPRPTRRSFHQDSRILTEQAASSVGADLILEGGGGDNVFCSLQSVTPVADALRAGIPLTDMLRVARDIAHLTEATLLTVLRRAWLRAFVRRIPFRSSLDIAFLTGDAAAATTDAADHPWLAAPPNAWPGSAAHIALLVAAQGWVEGFDPRASPPTLCPLLAQPIVEACLAVPSWTWFADGQNRIVAREAFRGSLPNRIIDRRSKATPDSFVTRLYEHNRHRLREMLLDGCLVANRLIDRRALENVLRAAGPPRSHDHRRVMRLADAEAWARARLALA